MTYEINYLVLQSKEGKLKNIRQATKDEIKKCGGAITEEKEFLKRKLAYVINNENYGFHTVLRFELNNPQEEIAELRKKINLNANISRYIIVKAEELPPLKDLFAKEQEEKRKIQNGIIKQEEVSKILAEEKKKKEEKNQTKNGDLKSEEKKEKIDLNNLSDEKSEDQKISSDVIDKKEKLQEKKDETDKKDDKNAKNKDKTLLDDLDKKLDEILDL